MDNMTVDRKVALPIEIKELYPMDAYCTRVFEERDGEIKRILSGEDDRLLLVIGPCSADREDSVMDYISRLVAVQEKVKKEILIIPRIYTNKPRTTGDGYKGMLHQPDPNAKPDMMKGLISIRELHIRAIRESVTLVPAVV